MASLSVLGDRCEPRPYNPIERKVIVKTDVESKQDMTAELAWDPAVKATAIGVAVKDGVVTLSGRREGDCA